MNAHHTCSLLGRRPHPGLRIRFCPDADARAGSADGGCEPGPRRSACRPTRRYSTALIVLNAKGGRLEGDKLILDGVQPTATLFTSRPARTVGHMATPEMVEIWRTGSFAKDPPNATASVFSKDGSSVADVVVVLKAAKLEGEKLTFDVAGAGRQPGQGRRAGLGVHRHAVVRRGLQRLQLLRHEPDHRRRDARHRRSARHQHVQRLVQPLAHPSLRAAAARLRHRGRRAAAARASIRAISSATTSRPAASPRCCPATEARHEPHPFPGRRSPPQLCLDRRVAAGGRADRRRRLARPRPSASRSSRASCRR